MGSPIGWGSDERDIGDSDESDDDSGGDEGDTDGSGDPIATLSPSTTSADVDERITFSVNDTSGSDRWITELRWDFGDGTSAEGW